MFFNDGSPAKSLFIDTSLTAIFYRYRCRWVGSCNRGVPFSEILVLTATRVFTIDPSRYEKTKTSPVMKMWERELEKGGLRERASREECGKKWGDKKCDTALPLPSFPPEHVLQNQDESGTTCLKHADNGSLTTPQQDMILSGEISVSLHIFLMELSFGKNHVVIHWKTETSEIFFLTYWERKKFSFMSECVTTKATKCLERFLKSFAHKLFGAKISAEFVSGRNHFYRIKMAAIFYI